MDDLETYQQEDNSKSVLLFPPLPSRLRYLIHRTVEDIPELTTFSVGESWCRRVVVCPFELRGESDEEGDFERNGYDEEPLSTKGETNDGVKLKAPVPTPSRAPKRPDKPLYVPRAARQRPPLQNSPGSTADKDLQSSALCSNSLSSPPDSCSCPEATELHIQPACAKVVEKEVKNDANSSGSNVQTQKLAQSLSESEAVVWDETQDCFAEMTLDADKREEQRPDNDQIEDTDMDDVTEQIKAHLKETDAVSIKLVHNDYSVYESIAPNVDDFSHVIEIYNFPAMFQTNDLFDAFADYSDGGMKIKWVDDTHALGVFSTEAAALQALSICHPLLKTRVLSEASKKAKSKAISRAEFIQPVKERPRTDCAVAKRMVTRALGIRGRGRLQQY